MEEQLTEFDLEGTLRSTGDSEDLIRRLVGEGNHTQRVHDMIKRNIEHIKIILGKEEVIASKSPRLVGFKEAVTLGEDFISVPVE